MIVAPPIDTRLAGGGGKRDHGGEVRGVEESEGGCASVGERCTKQITSGHNGGMTGREEDGRQRKTAYLYTLLRILPER